MAVRGALWLAKRLSLNLNFSFLNRISLLPIQVATQLSSRGWVDPVPDPILPEKFLGYSRESNPGPLGWQPDVLTTIPNRWSLTMEYINVMMNQEKSVFFFLLSSDIRSKGNIALLKKFNCDLFMNFDCTLLLHPKKEFRNNMSVCLSCLSLIHIILMRKHR